MNTVVFAAIVGAMAGFTAGSLFAVWWFRDHILFAERTPGFRTKGERDG